MEIDKVFAMPAKKLFSILFHTSAVPKEVYDKRGYSGMQSQLNLDIQIGPWTPPEGSPKKDDEISVGFTKVNRYVMPLNNPLIREKETLCVEKMVLLAIENRAK